MKKCLKLTVFAVCGLLILFLIAGVGGWLWLRSSLPDYSETLTFSGLKQDVTIHRDEYGVPTIIAANGQDAAFALGYSHAQDRLWQMDFMRRAVKGQMAEILGEKAVSKDRWYRTLGLHHLAYQDYQTLPLAMKEELQAYTKGINAYIENHQGAWPIEFQLLDYKPDLWQPEDCLLWGRYVAYDLSWNWLNEILKMRLSLALPKEKVNDLFPNYPQAGPTIFQGDGVVLTQEFWNKLWQIAPADIRKRQAASNAWVVDGNHSQSGSPLLANDPHLDFQIPGVWYLANIMTPEKQLSGVTVPLLPLMILGHNHHVAWGFTSAETDTADLFVEKLIKDGNQHYYATPQGPKSFETREETINVKGKDPVTFHVRHTQHGPVISDADPELEAAAGGDYVVALQATFLLKDNPTSYALYQMNQAKDSLSFFKALTSFIIPHQNILFATKDGTINFSSAGIVPLRRNNDGAWPSPGWEENSEWIGFVPLAAMPQWQNAQKDRIVNANHRLVDNSFPYFLGREWELPYRADRIEQLLQQQDKWDLEGFGKIQNDAFSGQAADLKDIFINLLDEKTRQDPLIQKLQAWDSMMNHQQTEPLLFTAWLFFVEHNLLINKVDEDLFSDLQPISPLFVKNALASPSWCELGVSGRTCQDLVQQSWREAVALLKQKLGDDPSSWQWGDLHRFYMDHPILRKLPYIHECLTPSFPVDGDNASVNRASPSMAVIDDRTFSDFKGAGYRGLFDLKDLTRSQFIISTGQSGHFLSSHYDDLTELWATGHYVTMSGHKEEAREKAKHTLILKPLK